VEKDDGMTNMMPLANRFYPVDGDWVEGERKKRLGVCDNPVVYVAQERSKLV
jgi:hypothetical protein